ncbi:peptidoglycan DD-metalloendopeptidase family protein [Azospirillum formosense]|uniref:Peptidoglycan DD-metalloendopeptidase family protein n=1 Tax=Azospirillum formosense TaxID=861533 RepID=A0ABX2KS66_9PROT|nr:M23 family metallopeptidase [Azospirillum formosense]MBY3755271.1 M23 family metallopeptidase [Azospirillum formosense]NUB17669.1 peptidoglycan DD-metalloendopeptidase family protein [Azospirillum formosense]
MIRTAVATLLSASLLTGALAFSAPAAAEAPAFGLPVECRVGETCFIQNYVDEDAGPGWRDHACGRLSYDGHDGTDFRLPDYTAMDKGVAVLAAAAGTVLRVRDGMEDVNVNVIGRDAVMKVGGGNAVVIDHGDGWQTAYLHMKRGSVAVTPGQRVEAGQRLGEVGLSGLTEFPHLHFGVRHKGVVVDPFVGQQPFTACGQTMTPLWNSATAKALAYRPTAGLSAGFATSRVPEAEPARHGEFAGEALTPDSPLLVLWSDIMGVRDGDTQRVRILDGDGRTLFDNSKGITGDKAAWFAYQGLKRPVSGWPKGPYKGIVTLTRDGKTVVTLERQLDVR